MSALTLLGDLALLIVIVALFNALAFWQRHIFLYILVFVMDMVFGLYYSFQSDPFTGTSGVNTATWVIGVMIAILGLFCLFRAVMKVVKR
jgi:hypothetical protein